jgi:histidinol-phosphate aminotransferase
MPLTSEGETRRLIMPFSRRAFVKTLGAGAAGAFTSAMIGARGREGFAALWRGLDEPVLAAETSDIILSSNENPLGPGERVLDAVRRAVGPRGAETARYPFGRIGPLHEAIAKKFGVKPENVLIGAGSTQILRTSVQVFTAPDRPYVGSLPTYEECGEYASLIGTPIKGVPLDGQLRFDIEPTLAAARGAGLVFYCNPNNPTATVHPPSATDDFIRRLHAASPETTILIDEAYIDYVTTPGHRSEIPRAVEDPRVVVARTFSKAYGMAGLRIGYAIAHKDTIKKMAQWEGGGNISYLSMMAALEAIGQDDAFIERERARNAEAREFTRKFFHDLGYHDSESQTNFLFVDVRMPIQDFAAACRKQGVRVARPFPPRLTSARISIGTMEEMRTATQVFAKVLKEGAKAAA